MENVTFENFQFGSSILFLLNYDNADLNQIYFHNV